MKISTLLIFSLISINSWGAKVLQIGDSHTVGAFGEQLYKSLAANSKVTSARSIGLASASGSHYTAETAAKRTLGYGYIDRPGMSSSKLKGTVSKLSSMLDTEKPNVLIVELGDNFAGYRSPDDAFAKNEVQKILKQIKNSKNKPSECYWVGPTWTDWVDDNGLALDKRKSKKATFYRKTNLRAKQIANLIKKEIDGQCTFIDSMDKDVMDKSEVKTADGIHCSQASGTLWGQKVYEAISGKSSLIGKSATDKPTGSTPAKKNR